MSEARVLYGGGSCIVWRRLVFCMAVREARFCMAEVRFCMAEAYVGRGFPPASTSYAIPFGSDERLIPVLLSLLYPMAMLLIPQTPL